MTYVGYIRVSHVGTRSGERFRSPEDQAAEIRAWAKRHGARVEILDPELDESGARRDRPILARAVEGIEAGRWEGLVVAYLSRFARSALHLLEIEQRIETAGGSVVYARENLDTSTPAGRMHRTVLAAVAEMERDQKVEDFARVTESAVARGLWKFRQVPIGYQLAGVRPCGLVPSTDAPKVLRAFERRAAGDSISSIARDMSMTAKGARHMLANRVYLGEIRAGTFVNSEAHEPIVPLDLFERVQAMHGVRPPRGKRGTLLAGLIRCQSCGHVMRKGTSGGHPVYACHGRHSAGDCPAPAAIMLARVDEYVSALARAELESLIITSSKRTGRSQKLRERLARAEGELAAYLAATEAAGIPLETFVAGARSRQSAIEDARAELERHHAIAPLGAKFDGGGELWDSLDVHERNLLLRGLLDAVVVRPVGHGANISAGGRTRIFVRGSIEVPARRGHLSMPIATLPFPDADDPRLIGVSRGEERLRSAGG